MMLKCCIMDVEVENLRIMAVDYGDARTGVAVSDASGILAGDVFVIAEWEPGRLAAKLAAEASSRGVERIVLGHPVNMNGTLGVRAEKSRLFSEMLSEVSGLPVVLWDERRTTVDAGRILSDAGKRGQKRKNAIDAVAASLILEGYLGSLR